MSSSEPEQIESRRQWMAVLANADFQTLENLWNRVADKPSFETLRRPETGLVMVRGRMGGKGSAFNLGEATVTRCSVRSSTGFTGHSYLLGRNHNHAQIAAQVDAMMQEEGHRPVLEDELLKPLDDERQANAEIERAKTAATKVDFFTMVRGEDG